jgi:signal peptidase I
VIAFWDPARGELEVKRVIAVGGDEVIVGGGMVIVNGQRLDEPYLREPMLREIPLGGRLAEDQLFVMGDNRNGSEDSRDFGPLAYDRVMGRLVYRILPLNRAGPLK